MFYWQNHLFASDYLKSWFSAFFKEDNINGTRCLKIK